MPATDRPQAAAGQPRVELLGDLDRPRAWMLLIDGVPQSHVDLDDPRHLELEYTRWLGHLIDLAGPAGTALRALHLGGGGLTMARYLAATRAGSVQLAVESSQVVANLVRRRLPVHQPAGPGAGSGQIEIRVGDARAILARLPAGRFDLVIADAFTGAQTPAHLTSAEFIGAAARVLAPSGWLAINIADGPPLAHARGRIAAVRSVFRHACVIAETAVLRGRSFGNLVVAASDRELPAGQLARRLAAGPVPARLLAGAGLAEFLAGAEPVTDASPVPPAAAPPEVTA